MPVWLLGGVRTGVQALWGFAVAWMLGSGAVPEWLRALALGAAGLPGSPGAGAHVAPEWVQALALAAITSLVTAGIRWLEHSGGLRARLGRWLMVGLAPPRR